MAYVGNTPALKYTSFAVQHFTTSATTGYTLSNAVNNENDIRLVINNVVQQPGASYAYVAAGTTLTLSAATTSSDTMYCVYIGKAVQTVNPGAASVGTSQLADESVNEAKLKVSNSPSNGQVLSAQSGASGGLTWAADAAGTVTGYTNGVDDRVITSSGATTLNGEANLNFNGTNLMVGTNATTGTASGLNDLIVGNTSSGSHGISIQTPNTETGYLAFADDSTSPNPCFISYDQAGSIQRFWVGGEELVRYNGALQQIELNYAETSVTGNVTCYLSGQTDSTTMQLKSKSTGTNTAIAFTDGDNSYSGGIIVNGSANTTAYATSSDYRLKENVNYDFDATTELKKLKPAKFNWKTKPSLTVEGFIAHEVSDTVPIAVQGTKDATETKQNVVLGKSGNIWRHGISEEEHTELKNKEGADDEMKESTWHEEKEIPVYQTIDQAKLVPLLTKALQEAITKIETLETSNTDLTTRLEALENA